MADGDYMQLTDALARIRARASEVNYAIATESHRQFSVALDSQSDVHRLLAAVDTALALADEWRAKSFELMDQLIAEDAQGTSAALKGVGSSVHDKCSTDLRAAITKALLGEDNQR